MRSVVATLVSRAIRVWIDFRAEVEGFVENATKGGFKKVATSPASILRDLETTYDSSRYCGIFGVDFGEASVG